MLTYYIRARVLVARIWLARPDSCNQPPSARLAGNAIGSRRAKLPRHAPPWWRGASTRAPHCILCQLNFFLDPVSAPQTRKYRCLHYHSLPVGSLHANAMQAAQRKAAAKRTLKDLENR